MKKSPILLTIVFLGLLFSNFYGYYSFSNAATNQLNDFSISGSIPSGISNLYTTEKYHYDLFTTGNYSYVWTQNITEGHVNMTCAALGIYVSDLRDPPYTLVVTNNISNPVHGVSESKFNTPRARMAQYFVLDNLSLIQTVRIYINATVGGLLPTSNFQIDIFNASDFGGGPITEAPHNIDHFGGGSHVEWLEIDFNEYLDPGEYYAVFSSWVSTGLLPTINNNSWCINNYMNSSKNKGPSLFENTSGWFSIADDHTADFLMEMDVVHYLSPYEVNLTAFLNNESVQLLNNRDYSVKTPKLGRPIWRSEISHYLDEPPSVDYNITILINKTVAGRAIATGARYVYNEPTIGTFFADLDTIRWNVDYKKVNSSSSLLVFFKFPRDWMITDFYSSFGIEIIEYGIYYSFIYGEYENGLWYDDRGDGTQTFEYTAIYTSPNYLQSGGIVAPREVYMGDSFKVQATIKNSEGEIVMNGNCNFYLFDPDGVQIYTRNKNNTNGIVSSDELDTDGWVRGTYSMLIVFYNGEEIGIILYSFEISLSPLILIAIIAGSVAIATVVALTYGRKKLAERNWEKSLHHLLIISKNGTPMYSYSFGLTLKDSALISGMLTALTSFMKEATGSKRQLKRIDQEDKKIILCHGTLTTVAILANKDLPIIHNRARELLERFEVSYADKIQKWAGNAEIFKGTNKIVEEFFPVEMEQILINQIGFELQRYEEMVETAEDKSIITAILSEVTVILDKYQDLTLKNYSKLINTIINKAHEKLAEE